MGKCNKSDYNHVLYNQNRARAKSGDKSKNAINHMIILQTRISAEGETKWLKMAMYKSQAKLKKYGITTAMVAAVKTAKTAA
jgi:hypothetical protein